MSTYIKDGTGKGYIGKVDSNNRVWVYATSRAEIAFQSEHNQRAFMSYTKRDFAAGSTDEGIFHLTYTGSGSLHIAQIILSTNSTLAKAELYVDSVYTSGGDLRTAINLNRKSSVSSESTIYTGESDLSFTYTDTKEIVDIRLSSNGQPSFKLDFQGGLILGTNNTLGLIGEVASAGDEMRASIYYYEEDDQ